MDALPIELVTIIACDDFELFTTLLRVNTIGQRLCEQYPQLIAKEKFICAVNKFDYKCTYLNGRLHSLDDQPAVEFTSGDKEWYRYGKKHRGGDLPAFKYINGAKKWYWNGYKHRENDLPAVVRAWGDKEWFWHGKRHRKGLPAIIKINGGKYWYLNGNFYYPGRG